ncbi:hypothetical protein GSU68_12840 [Rathayibacter sp. VKM Ac-2759]|uniref:hypothetical protein n=1 Tax=Rathayibacter sp. VKM Ac-2759 TaxID=2609252 RepID=UPI001318347E|nr:hypothetical protein [Rathayibacter sp. VKM Ac-2759]QHC67363.1 hypothetical protein GSU68_12840 [Rathayibacter sp. VKM Ac-2759]
MATVPIALRVDQKKLVRAVLAYAPLKLDDPDYVWGGLQGGGRLYSDFRTRPWSLTFIVFGSTPWRARSWLNDQPWVFNSAASANCRAVNTT